MLLCRSLESRPNDIPSHPHKAYKDQGWQGWSDFFGAVSARGCETFEEDDSEEPEKDASGVLQDCPTAASPMQATVQFAQAAACQDSPTVACVLLPCQDSSKDSKAAPTIIAADPLVVALQPPAFNP